MDPIMPLARGVGVDMCPVLSHTEAIATHESINSLETGNLLQRSGWAATRRPVVTWCKYFNADDESVALSTV